MNDTAETPLHPQATRQLADFGSSLRFSDLPHDVVEHLKLLVLDGLGCCLYGAGLPWTQTLTSVIAEQRG